MKGGGQMLMLKVVSSGSRGNSYILQSDNQILILDLGVKEMDIMKSIDFRVSDVVSCLISHKHL